MLRCQRVRDERRDRKTWIEFVKGNMNWLGFIDQSGDRASFLTYCVPMKLNIEDDDYKSHR